MLKSTPDERATLFFNSPRERKLQRDFMYSGHLVPKYWMTSINDTTAVPGGGWWDDESSSRSGRTEDKDKAIRGATSRQIDHRSRKVRSIKLKVGISVAHFPAPRIELQSWCKVEGRQQKEAFRQVNLQEERRSSSRSMEWERFLRSTLREMWRTRWLR